MKRPEGFDPQEQQPAPSGKKPTQQGKPPRAQKAPTQKAPTPKPQAKPAPSTSKWTPRPTAVGGGSREQRIEARRAARGQRKADRAEVRRFTRRARTRRLIVASIAGLVATLVALVLVAVYSPLLALRTITIDGTSRINAEEVQTAVAGQIGTPLALIDFGQITTQLSAFPLIRSYVTETVPPGTLLIHIVERQPVGSIQVAGSYRLVDPAGVTVQESTERTPGLPFIELGGADVTSPAFQSMVEVLLALPPELLAQVDTISARTRDDVTLVLTGVGQSVKWGSAKDSAEKAARLAALIAVTDPGRAGVFDVSAPGNLIFRPS